MLFFASTFMAVGAVSAVTLPEGWSKSKWEGSSNKGAVFDDLTGDPAQEFTRALMAEGTYKENELHKTHTVLGKLETTYLDGTVSTHGAKGSLVPFELAHGEYITAVDVRHYGTGIYGMEFYTNRNRTSDYVGGKDHGDLTKFTAPPGTGVRAFYGRASQGTGKSNSFHQIGFYYGPVCLEIESVYGEWVPMSTSSVEQTITVSTGTSSEYTQTDASTWAEEATKSVSAGFEFKGIGASASVSSTVSHSISQGYSSTFGMTEETSVERTYPPGTVWAWNFVVTNVCGTTTVSKGEDWVHTVNAAEPPCCPVGFAKDPEVQHGECTDPALDACGGGGGGGYLRGGASVA